MFRKAIPITWFCLTAVCGLAARPSSADIVRGLLERSPFGNTETRSDTGSVDLLEFRGVLEQGGRMLFSFFDPMSRRSTWIEAGNPTDEIAVKEYNATDQTVEVEFQGKLLVLTLGHGTEGAHVETVPARPGPRSSPLSRAANMMRVRPIKSYHKPFTPAEQEVIRKALEQSDRKDDVALVQSVSPRQTR